MTTGLGGRGSTNDRAALSYRGRGPHMRALSPGQGVEDGIRTRWFLEAEERGNTATEIDRGHPRGRAWTEGNDVAAHIHGSFYFGALHRALGELAQGDTVLFADWRGDAEELLDGPGTAVGSVLAGLSRQGVDVRGLVWRSHLDEEKFSEEENLH